MWRRSVRRLSVTTAAMGVGISLALAAPLAAGESSVVDPSDPTQTELHDPQLDASGGAHFPPLGGTVDDSTTQPPLVDTSAATLRQRDLSDSPMAPLPPAIVAGPIGIAVASWMAHRANRRGGRI
jgi:hypothetical protein